MKCYNCKANIGNKLSNCPHCGALQKATPELIEAAKAKDQRAISQLYSMTQEAVFYTIRDMIRDRDTVEDLKSDTFLKAFDKLDQLKEPEKFRGWVKSIARRRSLDYFRAKKETPLSEMEMILYDQPEMRSERIPEKYLEEKETCLLLKELADSLPEIQKEAIIEHHINGISVADIARHQKVCVDTVKSRLRQGRKKMRREIAARELEFDQSTKLCKMIRFDAVICFQLPGKEVQAA